MTGIFSKFFLFALNFVVFGIGIGVIALASLILSNGSEFQVLLQDGTLSVPIILLLLGIVVMIIGFFGCFGALRESPCMLYTYAAIVTVLLIAQIGIAVFTILNRDDLEEFIANHMIDIFEDYGGSDQDMTDAINAAQNQLHCCGVYNYTDWATGVITNTTLSGGEVPYGCCRSNSSECMTGLWANKPVEDASVYIYTQGCFTLFIETVEAQALWLAIGAVALGLMQLFCVVIACGIGRKGGRKQHA